MSETRITIRTNPKWRPLAAIYSAAWILGVIGIGIWAESSAMQWAGFVFLGLMLICAIAIEGGKNKGLTLDEARSRLAEIAAREATH